ncbi:NAD(P)-binding domain-containing protein [Streptomyces sp. NPDC087212]|uniref:NAD(P)-binding domain-containing protein n=1 Tax=Streptomyces sp. NPDC087212 TaxID=3365766 RepID=UPI0038227C86
MSVFPGVMWIGLGVMGSPMSENLVEAGYHVTGFALEQAKLDRLAAVGGSVAGSITAAVRDADVIIMMVPASPQVEAVAYGPDGILAHALPGALLIDRSSITPQTSIDLAQAALAKGVRVLDAPVSGGDARAVEAVLSIMVGGEQADFEAAKPLFNVIGGTVVRCGPHGSGQTAKAANQLIVKDLGTATPRPPARPARRCRAVPIGAVVAQLVASLRAQGDGGLDHSALLRSVERLSGAQV